MIACAVALRDALQHRGFVLRVTDDLLYVSPASALTDDDHAAIRRHLPMLKALASGGATAVFIERVAAVRAEAFALISGRPRCHQCGQEAPADGTHSCLNCRNQTSDISPEIDRVA